MYPFLEGFDNAHIDDLPSSSTKSPVVKSPHCSHCGHPGSKKNHNKHGCNYCLVDSLENCVEKPAGFKCECPSCDEVGFYSFNYPNPVDSDALQYVSPSLLPLNGL